MGSNKNMGDWTHLLQVKRSSLHLHLILSTFLLFFWLIVLKSGSTLLVLVECFLTLYSIRTSFNLVYFNSDSHFFIDRVDFHFVFNFGSMFLLR